MLIRLFRNFPHGLAITGCLYVDSIITAEGLHQYQLSMNTLEHLDYAIPDGFYRLRMTYSPRFKEVLPLLDNVFGYAYKTMESSRLTERLGIRIHAGNSIEHTTGCILVGDAYRLENGSDAYSLGCRDVEQRLCHSRRRLEELKTYLFNYTNQNPYEEIYIQLESPDPYPDADLACPYEQQQHIYESLRRAKELREVTQVS